VILAVEWQSRALIRAQLIEEGFDVAAVDDWSAMRQFIEREPRPRAAVVDLKSLPHPREALDGLRARMSPNRVLVLTASGTLPPGEITRMGFGLLSRPFAIRDVVEAIASMLRAAQ
jgi:DNA-binding response OmpR family regulator